MWSTETIRINAQPLPSVYTFLIIFVRQLTVSLPAGEYSNQECHNNAYPYRNALFFVHDLNLPMPPGRLDFNRDFNRDVYLFKLPYSIVPLLFFCSFGLLFLLRTAYFSSTKPKIVDGPNYFLTIL